MNINPLSYFADYLGISSLLLPVISAQLRTLPHYQERTA